MPESAPQTSPSPQPAASGDGPILVLCLTVFLCYLTVGLPLPVIPIFVRHDLGFADWLVGLAVGIQFMATVSTRKYAGAMADRAGGDAAARRGLMACSLAGLAYMAAAALPGWVWAKLAVLMLGRVLLGMGESLLLTGVLAWTIGLAGAARSGRIMAWVGMAIYGSLAVGGPLGLALAKAHGFMAVALVTAGLPFIGLVAMRRLPRCQPQPTAARLSFARVLGSIWRPGLALSLQGVGFAGIGAFVSLFFAARHWAGAGLALTAFGGAFVLARVFFGGLPDRLGGARVALAFFVIESAGQAVLALASTPAMALAGAACTGFGCSLIFPALGVETVHLAPPESRGTALGAFAAFQDVSYALTGPLTGTLAGFFGYQAVFVTGCVAAALGLLMTLPLLARRPAPVRA